MKKLLSGLPQYTTWLISAFLFFLVANFEISTGGHLPKGMEMIFKAQLKAERYDEAVQMIESLVIKRNTPQLLILISFIALFTCVRKNLDKIKPFANHLHWALGGLTLLFISFKGQLN